MAMKAGRISLSVITREFVQRASERVAQTSCTIDHSKLVSTDNTILNENITRLCLKIPIKVIRQINLKNDNRFKLHKIFYACNLFTWMPLERTLGIGQNFT